MRRTYASAWRMSISRTPGVASSFATAGPSTEETKKAAPTAPLARASAAASPPSSTSSVGA